ncbi:MAG: pseudouridine synthase [Clostridia bacterium]|nr:pseudouridine synthase [Clostridia bacterium]
MRINKYIAKCGVCSRRKADELIQNGSISVNGSKVTDLGMMVDEEKDKVSIYDKELTLEEKKVYIMLNKPKGYVTTNDEQFGRDSTVDLIQEEARVYPIGRLDMYTEGLLLLTNDGDFANKLTHPKHDVEKVYVVKINGKVSEEQIEKLKVGVDIGDYITREAKVERKSSNLLQITISEGKNRQVRKMCEAVDLKVLELKRIQIGHLKLGDLPLGKYRYLTENEIKNI